MIIKYKVSDFAKDVNLSAKRIMEELAVIGSQKKNSANLEENELNYLLEKLSRDNSTTDLESYLNGGKPQTAKPAEAEAASVEPVKAEAPKAEEKKPEAPKVEEKKAEAPKAEEKKPEAVKSEQPRQERKPEQKRSDAPRNDRRDNRDGNREGNRDNNRRNDRRDNRDGNREGNRDNNRRNDRRDNVQNAQNDRGQQNRRDNRDGNRDGNRPQNNNRQDNRQPRQDGQRMGQNNNSRPQNSQSAQQPVRPQPVVAAPVAPKAEPRAVTAPVNTSGNNNAGAKRVQKPEQPHKKREEKTVSMSELAEQTGAKADTTVREAVAVRREDNQITVDTRTVDMNVERFDARYDELASTKNTDNRRKSTPQGNKQKFTQRSQRQKQQFQKGNKRGESEFERLQRLQLEKARNAQLKVSIPDEITVGELATRLKQQAGKVIAKFMQMGEMHAINDVIDFDTASLVAEEFHAKVEHEIHVTIEERLFVQEEDAADDLQERPPVVCVMGHVDHGKTSILDAIRKTNVTAGEAGGITQAIGAYQVRINSSLITFLDTPGHEAFTSMRARGANMTDIAVLVVAADDGIMPQTVESINHAKAAGVKVIVAMNKMDKPTANPERVKEGLTKYGLVAEDWGGDVACIPVSAMTGDGIEDLLERIALEAEVMELKANPNRRAKGAVVEARLDKGQGPIGTILVQNGTLHVGDVIIAGTAVGRVRTMRDDKGRNIETAGPSTPVEITGLTDVPEAGDLFEAVEDERLARELAERRVTAAKEKQFAAYQKVTLDNLFTQMAENDMKELAIVVKADVQGSAEAVKQSLEKISNEEVRVRVIHAGVGAVSKSDVDLADASNAIIIGFNVRPDNVAKEAAAATHVEMRMYRVIYDAINDVTDAMKGMLAPKFREVSLGELQVRQVYKISNVGTVAGCRVTNGKITRDSKVRVVRDGIVLAEDEIASLKRFKDDVKEVAEGYECGVTLAKFADVKEGDVYEAFKMEEYRD